VLGEMALLTGEPRSATAYAVRDTQLACLDRPSFDQMVAAHPQEMLGLFVGNLADRLRQQNGGKKPQPRPPVTIAVLVCSAAVSEFPKRLAQALSVFADTLHLDRASVEALTPERPVAADAADTRLLSWLNEQETRYQHVVYETDTRVDPWTLLCLSQADTLFVAADAEDDPAANHISPSPLAWCAPEW
jgi:NTE family protein